MKSVSTFNFANAAVFSFDSPTVDICCICGDTVSPGLLGKHGYTGEFCKYSSLIFAISTLSGLHSSVEAPGSIAGPFDQCPFICVGE